MCVLPGGHSAKFFPNKGGVAILPSRRKLAKVWRVGLLKCLEQGAFPVHLRFEPGYQRACGSGYARVKKPYPKRGIRDRQGALTQSCAPLALNEQGRVQKRSKRINTRTGSVKPRFHLRKACLEQGRVVSVPGAVARIRPCAERSRTTQTVPLRDIGGKAPSPLDIFSESADVKKIGLLQVVARRPGFQPCILANA